MPVRSRSAAPSVVPVQSTFLADSRALQNCRRATACARDTAPIRHSCGGSTFRGNGGSAERIRAGTCRTVPPSSHGVRLQKRRPVPRTVGGLSPFDEVAVGIATPHTWYRCPSSSSTPSRSFVGTHRGRICSTSTRMSQKPPTKGIAMSPEPLN
jgi:hypothetical protein